MTPQPHSKVADSWERAGFARHTPALALNEPPRGPLTCDICFRFVSVKDAVLSHEFGDYGSILSTAVFCPRCAA